LFVYLVDLDSEQQALCGAGEAPVALLQA